MRKELIAAILLIGLVLGVALAPVIGRRLVRTDVIEIHARTPENGGWSTMNLEAKVGEPLHLRLTSDDVVHGFALGQTNEPMLEILPGEFVETSLTFDRPGTYTFYCTRWCGVNHWRMRGTIQVSGPEGTPEKSAAPLYVRLGLDLDVAHPEFEAPGLRPSVSRGRALGIEIPEQFAAPAYLREHSPLDLFGELKGLPLGEQLTDQQVWDLVALAWAATVTPQELADGRELYAENCAACHGESGKGDGVMADNLAPDGSDSGMDDHSLPTALAGSPPDDSFGHSITAPSDFTDYQMMLAHNSAALQGKILRGGMGTGMPYWGSIFTEEQTWELVGVLWGFVMEE